MVKPGFGSIIALGLLPTLAEYRIARRGWVRGRATALSVVRRDRRSFMLPSGGVFSLVRRLRGNDRMVFGCRSGW